MSTEITITSTTIDINVTESPITIEAPSGAYPLPTSVYSVFGRTGNVVAAEGDYTLTQLAGVTITSPVSGQALVYNGTSWVNNTETYVGTVTSVSALTLGTTGTDLTSTVANSTTTPVITLNVPTASASNRGALSSADWSIFNAKQPALNGTGFVKISGTTISYDNSTYYLASNPTAYIPLTALSSTATGLTYTNTTGVFSTTAGYGIPTTASQTTWDAAYNDKINSAAVTGTTTKTLTLNQQDGGTVTASWTDDNTDAVTSVFGRTGAVVSANGDYTTTQVTEGTNLYYTDVRARASNSFVAGSGAYNSTTGVITIPTNNNQITNGANYITLTSLSASAPLSYSNTTGAFSISQANTSTDGYLSSFDWNTFNNKQIALTLGNLTSSDITVTGGTGAVIGTGSTLTLATVNTNVGAYGTSTSVPTITVNGKGLVTAASQTAIPTASSSVTGLLTSANWSTFNDKQNQLNGTGFVKASGTTITYDNSTYLTTIEGIAAGGELSGTYASPSLVNSAVTGKVLTGVNITGGTIADTDSILTAFGKVQNQINGLIGGSIYQGTWNASTNTPTLTSSVGTAGYYYIVSVAGTTNLNGITDWQIGDWVIYQGTEWEKVDNTDAVVSVNGFTGAVSLTTSNISEGSNLYYTDVRARTSISGSTGISYNNTTGVITNSAPDQTVTLTGAGTTSISGTYPSFTITSNDTYNGTVTSIGITESVAALSITGSPVTTSGNINIGFAGTNTQYVAGDGSLVTFPSIISDANNLVTEIYNNSGATLTKGTVVYINGGQGNLPTVAKALATSDSTSAQTYGFINADITNMNNGFVTIIGSLENLDTSAFANGTQLYLSGTTAGTYTSTKPQAPIHLVYVAIVVRSHPTQGVLEVKIQNGVEMDEIHDVQITSIANGNILQYSSADSLWHNVAGTTTNIAEGTNLYYTDTRARTSISTTATGLTYTSGTGVISLTAGYVIPTTSSATNWDTAYTNRITSATSPISIAANVISIAQATTSTSGYLSSTDWTTFNNKQNALTNPVTGTGTTNYLPKFTGTSTIGDSAITDNGTTVTLVSRALAGTSATFSGLITYSGTSQILNAASGTTGYLYQYLANTSGAAYFGLERNTGGGLFTGSSNYATVLGSATATSLQFGTNGIIRATIDSAGNVGIGTSSPSGKLHLSTTSDTYFVMTGGATPLTYSWLVDATNLRLFNGVGATTLLTIASTGAATFSSKITAATLSTIGTAVAATNVQLNLNGVSGKAQRIEFQHSGVQQWLIGCGASSETNAFEIFNSTGVNSIAINKSTNAVTFGSTIAAKTESEFTGTSVNTRVLITASGVANTVIGFNNSGATTTGVINNAGYVGILQAYPLIFTTDSTERMRILANGRVGINTNAPDARLEVQLGSGTTTAGLFYNYTGDVTATLMISRCGTTSGFYHFQAFSTTTTEVFRIESNGNVKNTNNSYGALSDIKLKENITDATSKLEDLLKVRIRNYNIIGEDVKQIGVIAQELEEIFPSMVDENQDRDNKGNLLETTTKGVKYSVFVPILIKAIQEQQAIITSLQDRLDKAGL